jgi:hypothetical protein
VPHPSAKMPAISELRVAGRHSQQLSAERQEGLGAAVGEEAEEANAHEAMWKHMQKKAAQELVGRHRHELLFAAVGVIFQRNVT